MEADIFVDFFDQSFICTTFILFLISCILFIMVYLPTLFVKKLFIEKSNENQTHVGRSQNVNKYGAHFTDEETSKKLIYDYLYDKYWKKRYEYAPPRRKEISAQDLRPVLRITDTERRIHVVYSKSTLWELVFSEKLECGVREKFGFVFKGLKSWSLQETQGRFSDVTEDLLKFRQVRILLVIFAQQLNFYSKNKLR